MRDVLQRLLTGVARAGQRDVLQRLLTGVARAGHVLVLKRGMLEKFGNQMRDKDLLKLSRKN
jgi:hypothetical protein